MATIKKISFQLDDGTVHYLEGKDAIQCMYAVTIHQQAHKRLDWTWKEEAPAFKLQRVYFALVEEVAKNTGGGYTKDSLHAALKPMLFNKIQDNVANFTDNVVVHSTKNLTHHGWVSFIEQFKEFTQDIFGYVCEQ